MLSILEWWAIPIGAVIVAAAVSGVVHRVRRLSDDETIERYQRFRDAIANDDAPGSTTPSA